MQPLHAGMWTWDDQRSPPLWAAWGPGQPASTGACAVLALKDGTWSVADCSVAKPYVCIRGEQAAASRGLQPARSVLVAELPS